MSDSSFLRKIFSRADQLEKEYDWVGAAESYEKALSLLSESDLSRKGETYERLGYALHRAAFQSEDKDDFRTRARQAVAAYEEAKELHGKLDASGKARRTFCCDAMIGYLGYWLASEVHEKKRLLDECCRIEREALMVYEEGGDQLDLGKTYVELAGFLSDRLDLELDMQVREKILDEALNLGEKAIQIFSRTGDEAGLARANCLAGINCYDAGMSLQMETKRKECVQKAFEYAREAIRISEKVGDDYILGKSTVCLGFIEDDLGEGIEVGSNLFRRALQHCNKTKDHRTMSEAFDGLAFATAWSMFWKEDLEEMRDTAEKSGEYATKAINYSVPANYGRGILHSYGYGYLVSLRILASGETKLETRYELLKKAATLGKQGLKHAQSTGSTHAILHATTELAHVLYDLSTMEAGVQKRQLLEEAMTLGEKAVNYTEQLRPHYTLPQSLPYETLALIRFELSKLEGKAEKRRELLEKAVSDMETCIELCQRHVISLPSRRELLAILGSFETELGNLLNHLYQITFEKETLKKLAETYESAVQLNKKADLASRVAEAYWQTAVACDRLEDYLDSASNFESASKQYEISARNTPQLGSFYRDYVTYMEAWSFIERAKHSYEREEYSHSKDYYEKAASALRSSKSWIYLAPNYSAWACLEHAEDLSRDNQSQEAIGAFKEAAELFNQARESIEAGSDEITSSDEKEMALKLAKAAKLREEYCLARTLVEEAKNLFTAGECMLSAEKYELAADSLKKLSQTMETEAEIKELLSMIYMCQAWQKMSVAEEMADAALYSEASVLFAKAKESSAKKRTAMLAAGNSSICRALESGVKYKASRNVIFYYEAKHCMESASDYYMDAGFRNESIWVSATEALFDAYFYMDKAETEADHTDKTKFYGLVEGYLDRSTKLLSKAGYAKKAGDVLKTLERVREKREFALSLDKVLVAPAVVSSTASMSVPTPSHEEAVGLERFEHADIQASLMLRERKVTVGEDLTLGIDVVNAGKGYALLIKVEEITPKGFEAREVPEIYRIEDSSLDMRGKRLGPLKTEEVKLTIRPLIKGVFSLKPIIHYLDETGRYKSYEIEPVTISVKEIGIKGWLKGER